MDFIYDIWNQNKYPELNGGFAKKDLNYALRPPSAAKIFNPSPPAYYRHPGTFSLPRALYCAVL